MALDPSIILSGQQQPSFADTYGKAIQLKALVNQGKLQDLQYQQTQQDMEGARKLRDLYSGNINEDGSINRAGILQGAASQGLGDKIQGLQKSWAETDKATADLDLSRAKTGGEHFDIAKKKLDAVNGMLGSLLTRPDVSQNDVAAGFAQLAQQGLIENDEAVRAMRSLPAPEQLRPYLIQKANEGLGAMKQMELAQQRAIADQNASVTRRGQDMTADTQRQLASQGVSIQTDANGNMIVVPNRAPAGSPVTAAPVLDAGGRPIAGKDGGLNDSQSKALLFGSRMREADSLLGGLSEKGVDRPSVLKTYGEKTPVVGSVVGDLLNSTQSSDQQQVEQAQRDFINAVLRRESGAAISSSEFDNARKQYFPQPGDSGAVKEQKAMNRQLATKAMLAEVPAAKRNSITPDAKLPDKAGAIPPTNNRGWALHTDAGGNRAYVSPDGSQYEEVQ